MATPAGMVQSEEIASESITRKKVAPAALQVAHNSAAVIPRNTIAASKSAYSAARMATAGAADPKRGATREAFGDAAGFATEACNVSLSHAGLKARSLSQRT